MLRMIGKRATQNLSLQAIRNISHIYSSLANLQTNRPSHICLNFEEYGKIWTTTELRNHSESLALGLNELGLERGDTIAIWLPNFVEKVLLQFAVSIGGQKLVIVDPSYSKRRHFEKVLMETRTKLVVVEESLIPSLKNAVPEMEFFASNSDYTGRAFRSRTYKGLERCCHTGFGMESGFLQFRNIPDYTKDRNKIKTFADSVNQSNPISVIYQENDGNFESGPILTHANVLSDQNWSTVAKILNNDCIKL